MGGTALGRGELGWCPVVKDPGKQKVFLGWDGVPWMGSPRWNSCMESPPPRGSRLDESTVPPSHSPSLCPELFLGFFWALRTC